MAWAVTGPLFHYSDTWQLVINTGTTVVAFLMVFLIQQSQNKASLAIQPKLNELPHAHASLHDDVRSLAVALVPLRPAPLACVLTITLVYVVTVELTKQSFFRRYDPA